MYIFSCSTLSMYIACSTHCVVVVDRAALFLEVNALPGGLQLDCCLLCRQPTLHYHLHQWRILKIGVPGSSVDFNDALGATWSCGIPPLPHQGKFWIQTSELFLVQSWVEIASVGQPTAKPSHGVQMLAEKAWLRFTLQVIHVKCEVLYSLLC